MWTSLTPVGLLTCVLIVSSLHAEVQRSPVPVREGGEPPSSSVEDILPYSLFSQSQGIRTACKSDQDISGSSPAPIPTSRYVPLSTRGKFNIFFRSTYDISTLFSAGFEGTLAQAEGQWRGYGGGFPGWGKRIGASLADTEARKFIQSFALSSVLHQDPRYFRSHSQNHLMRAAYAVSRVAITRSDSGKEVFNSSELLGTLFTASLQNSYYPGRQRGLERTMERFWTSFTSDATSNLLKEFWPDIRRLFRKHAPGPMKKIEDHMPEFIAGEITP